MSSEDGTSSESSVARWIADVKCGDSGAEQKIWERYVDRLVRLARSKLDTRVRRAEDEEDIVQSVFKSFYLRAREGRFPKLTDPDELWSLLVVMTDRKSKNHANRARCLKRGGGKVRGESALQRSSKDDPRAKFGGFDEVAGNEPTADFAHELAENFKTVLSRLSDAQRRVACLKMEGYSREEIAEQLGCSVRSIARRLDLIRRRLEEDSP